jgi:hypothetical protein
VTNINHPVINDAAIFVHHWCIFTILSHRVLADVVLPAEPFSSDSCCSPHPLDSNVSGVTSREETRLD